MSNTYKCANCQQVFEKGRSDEEAAAELTETFPGFDPSQCDIVCDDCFQKIMSWKEALPLCGKCGLDEVMCCCAEVAAS